MKGKTAVVPDDVYYSGEQNDFDVFAIPADHTLEYKTVLFKAEVDGDFDNWEEEALDSVIEKEFKKQQVELKRKEDELQKISQVISKKKKNSDGR